MTTVEDTPLAASTTDSEPAPHATRRRRRRLWPAVGLVLVTVGVGTWLWARGSPNESRSAPSGPVATATVERGAISATQSWDGTVDRGVPLTINSSTGGTVTRLIGQGTTVERGGELYRVDERPVILLYGIVPMYRDLAPGAAGADVAQLEANLVALGHARFTADDTYTDSTAATVRGWQTATGAAPTGSVAHGDVVFIPDSGRADVLRVSVGDLVAPGTPIVDLTGTTEAVSLDVDIADRDRFAIGSTVTVVLPNGEEVAGTTNASTIVAPAAEARAAMDDNSQAAEPVTRVHIGLPNDIDDSLVGAPVEVVVAIDQRADVLLVPVNALLALAEGGYGLEVVRDDGTTHIVPVDTGLFADGKVQVEGDGIREGTVVGVAGR